ncbi:hypothetical protein FS749_013377 [Ceratobasidium sp. UAMH 11750]|nr:hypothetical protein FS749_013377 [Ceratobasidium sp. UAMH 11750]
MPSTTMHSPRSKKVAGGPPPTTVPQPQQKRSTLRYSLNNIGKALADVVGKESKGSTVSHSRIPSSAQYHIADRSVTASSLSVDPPIKSRRPSIAAAFGSTDNLSAPPTRAPSQAHTRSRTISTTKGLPQHVASTPSPKRASPAKLATAALPMTRRRSLVKGALAAPASAPAPAPTATPVTPVPIGTTKLLIRPKTAIPRTTPGEEDRTVEVKGRAAESPRATHAAVGRTRERHDSRASPVRTASTLSIPTPKGRASPVRTNSNDQTPNAKDEREKRRERREREKQAQEEKERERREAKEREKEQERTKKVEAEKAREAVSQRIPSGHRTSSSTTTLTSASSIFTGGRNSTGDSQSSTSGSARPSPQVSKAQAAFPRAAQVVLTPPDDDEEEDEDITISTPATRSRTTTGGTNFAGDISTPAISRTLLASISAQTESPILAPLDQRLRHSGSIPSLSSGIPSPIHPGSMPFPPPANMRAGGAAANKGNEDDEDEEWEEGDVSALLATCVSPVKGQSTPAMPRFAIKSSRSRAIAPQTPSRAGLPTRETLSYVSSAMPAPGQRAKGDKAGNKANLLAPVQTHRAPRESILSWDALVERSRLEEGELEDMLRAPAPAVGLVSPDMRPARSLPPLAEMTKRMNLGGMSESETEIGEEQEVGNDKTANANAGRSISQVLFPPPMSPKKKSKSQTKEREREMAEKERAWAAKEEAWRAQQVEWESERAKWESERGQWDAQQSQWSIQRNQWNAQQVQWAAQQSQWETHETEWAAREKELTQAVQARDDDLEALGQESSAHISELAKQSSAYEALKQQVEKHSQELRAAREREAKVEAQTRCLGAMNAWSGVLGSLKADKEACAADRAALKVILLGLEAMVKY